MMSISDPNTSKALIERIYRDGYNGGDPAVFRDCYAPDFIHHSKVIHDVSPGGQGEFESRQRFRQAIPDVHFAVLGHVAEADWCATRIRITGTQVQDYGTVHKDDSDRFDRHVLALFRVADGRVAEEWLFTDAVDGP